MITQTKKTFWRKLCAKTTLFVVLSFVFFQWVPQDFFLIDIKSAQALNLTKGDGILFYGQSANTSPQVRLYGGGPNTFGSPISAPAGAVPGTLVIRTSPKKQETVAAYSDTSGNLRVLCYDGNSTTSVGTVVTGGTGATRRFDLAYETNSGDVLIAYSTGVANQIAYSTKSGSSDCSTPNWSLPTTIPTGNLSGVIQWVRLAWDRRASSDLIAIAVADSNADLTAALWSGSSWANEVPSALAVNLDRVSSVGDVEPFDLEFESVSGDLMVAWGIAVGNNNNGVRYSTCTGGVVGCTWSSVLTPPTFNDDATNLDISASPDTDEIIFASIGNNQDDLQIGYWSGSAWTNDANTDKTSESPYAGSKLVATGWLVSEGTRRGIVTYQDSNATNIGWYTTNGGVFSKQTDVSPTPSFANPQATYRIEVDPIHRDRLMFLLSDSNNDLFAKRLVMTAAPAFTWTDADGGSALELNVSQQAPGAFSFAYWRYAPTFDQAAYRWFENNNAANIGVISVNPSSGVDLTRDADADSQYHYSVGSDSSPGNAQWRIEKRLVSSYDLEPTFGGGSGVMTNNPSSGNDQIYGIDIDNTYLYVVGNDASAGGGRWRIEKRYKSTGFTNFSFGSLGVATSDPSANADWATAVGLDTSYLYVVGVDATAGDNRWRIEKRSKTTGALEPAFGISGVVTSNPSAGDDQPNAILVAGGYIYVAGYDSTPGNKQFRVEKRSILTGALDASFGVAGVITSNLGTGDDVWSKVINVGGTLVLAGYDSSAATSNTQWRVEKRSLATGALDGSFGTGGVITSNPSSSSDELLSIHLSGSFIYLGGLQTVSGSDTQWRVEKRSSTTGAVDGGFGTTGVITTNPGGDLDGITSVIVTSSSLLMSGVSTSSGNYGWRFEKRSSSTGSLAKALANQNTSAQLAKINDQFRLRLLLTIGQSAFVADQDFKLQFAQKSGTCDTAFSGETYTDVTNATSIAFYDNSSVADGVQAASSTLDPTTGNTVQYQTYEEVNNFTNTQSTIPVGQDGLWDFALYDRSAPVGTSYCFRVVKSNGDLLDTYTQIPEIITAAGALTIDFVDSVGSSVDNPLIVMSDIIVNKVFQTAMGTLGASDEKIRVRNTTSNPQWQISIASSGGAGSLWSNGSDTFDFNDPTANAGDGGDADAVGGQMTLNPTIATVTPQSGCTNTGLSLGSSGGFSEGVTDSRTLLTAGASTGLNCYWDTTGIGSSQTVPAFQPSGTYNRAMTITITAL